MPVIGNDVSCEKKILKLNYIIDIPGRETSESTGSPTRPQKCSVRVWAEKKTKHGMQWSVSFGLAVT